MTEYGWSSIEPYASEAAKVAPFVAQFPPDTRLHIRQMVWSSWVREVVPCPHDGCSDGWCWRAGDWIVTYDDMLQL